MFESKTNLYSKWRAKWLSHLELRERHAQRPTESLVRAIWLHQRLRRSALKTLDGLPVRVWHPGFPNAGPGPDFHDAIIQLGDASARTGDIEVDLEIGGWRSHRHHQNPAFANVVLHVVWNVDREDSKQPTLALCGALDAPIEELSAWLDREPSGAWPEALGGACSAPLKQLSGKPLLGLLHDAARVRWESKAAHFRARAREAGWEQAFWEGMFRALGYKHNVWPMQNLAEGRATWNSKSPSVVHWQGRLLGLANLLPAEVPRNNTATTRYVREVWDCWWRERDGFAPLVLPRSAWRLTGLRPANHPQRRLALAAHWLNKSDLITRLEAWLTDAVPVSKLAAALLEMLQAPRDDYWSWHWTLRSSRMPRPQPLLGLPRVTDLATNVILPWLWVRAVEGGNVPLQCEAERRYFLWPAGEDNARLKFARRRLLGGSSARVPAGSAAQQGLLQILHDFCARSNSLCEQCQFPALVRDWRGVSMDRSVA